MEVTTIDWNDHTNNIISGAADRSVFVWVFEDSKWKPEFVNLDEKLCILDIAWSKLGHKAVAGTSSNNIFVIYKNEES